MVRSREDLPGNDAYWSLDEETRAKVDAAKGWEPLVNESENDSISQLASSLGIKLNDDTKDYLVKYYLDEQSNDKAWARQMNASNTQYQRAVADLKAAGLNPFLALQSLSGSSPSISGTSAQGGLITSRQNSKRETSSNIGKTILTVLGIIAAAVIHAL